MKTFSKLMTLAVLMLGLTLPAYAEKIVLEGSTTVLPIAQKAAEVYMDKNPGAQISVRGGGSVVRIIIRLAIAPRKLSESRTKHHAGPEKMPFEMA